MGWQDRDYARGVAPARPGWTQRPYSGGGGRSIVTTLIVINVVLYVLGSLFPTFGELLSGGQRRTPFGIEIKPGIAEMRADLVMRGQLWRLITAQYLHASIGHIFMNMLVLHFLGRSLEQMWSARKFVAIYTMCGIAGNVFFTILAARGVIPTWMPAVGASGCIYGLLGIAAVLFPHATVYIYFLFPMKIRTVAYIFGGIALFSIIQRGANYGGEACHLAGLGFGVWWAMKGDGWWISRGQYTFSRFTQRFRSSGKRAPTRSAGGFAAKMAERRDDADTIDRILKKVYEGGIHSLSESEKRALRDATERQQQRERDAGRIDRL